MSRVANQPIPLPSGVEVTLSNECIAVKGKKGNLELALKPALVKVAQEESELKVSAVSETKQSRSMSGTVRAIINNMVIGVDEGFQKKLTLVGVGYRAQAQGKKVNLSLGFSHPVEHQVPEGITVQTPSQTEIVVEGADKQQVGQVAAEIRAYRPPEPYKGKGVRYSDEVVIRKEAKKK